MLQQTTVETVIPYYERFLKRFPTIDSLAKAAIDEVLSLWSGLGYYSRARNLHAAAKQVTAVPDSVEGLMELPGIGRYTAGAIASIAFGRRTSIVDGNVIRVLSRLFRIGIDPRSPQGQKIFWRRAEEVLPKNNCGAFNQALMELGATVCLPVGPSCRRCPVRVSCKAFQGGSPELFPRAKKKTRYRSVTLSAALVIKDSKVLFVRRPGKGLLKGLWEIPMVEGGAAALERRWRVRVLGSLPPVKHAVLNRRMTITPFTCRPRPGWTSLHNGRWIDPARIDDLATSSMNRKILATLEGVTRQ